MVFTCFTFIVYYSTGFCGVLYWMILVFFLQSTIRYFVFQRHLICLKYNRIKKIMQKKMQKNGNGKFTINNEMKECYYCTKTPYTSAAGSCCIWIILHGACSKCLCTFADAVCSKLNTLISICNAFLSVSLSHAHNLKCKCKYLVLSRTEKECLI